MKVKQFRYSADNFTYLLYDKNSAAIIDGGAIEDVLLFLEAHRLNLKYIVNTHGHADHISGLTEMLASIRHSARTPLYFGIDSVQIVAAALRKFDPAGPELTGDPRRLCADFDRIARSALGCSPATDQGLDDESPAGDVIPTLAAWFEQRHRTMGSVHPLALDVLALLIEGESPREVAERLDLGLRLIRRIVRDASATWTEGPGPCSSR